VVEIPSFWDERKLLVFLALIIVASAVMLIEIDAARRGRQSLADQFAGTVVGPIQGALMVTGRAIATEAYVATHARVIGEQDAALAAKARALAAVDERLKEHAVENRELLRMLAVRSGVPGRTIEADVVGYAPEAARREL